MKKIESKKPVLIGIHARLVVGSLLQNYGKKLRDLGAAQVATFLSSEKSITLSELNVGETIVVQFDKTDCITVEITTRNGLDQEKLQRDFPDAFNSCYGARRSEKINPNKSMEFPKIVQKSIQQIQKFFEK